MGLYLYSEQICEDDVHHKEGTSIVGSGSKAMSSANMIRFDTMILFLSHQSRMASIVHKLIRISRKAPMRLDSR